MSRVSAFRFFSVLKLVWERLSRVVLTGFISILIRVPKSIFRFIFIFSRFIYLEVNVVATLSPSFGCCWIPIRVTKSCVSIFLVFFRFLFSILEISVGANMSLSFD